MKEVPVSSKDDRFNKRNAKACMVIIQSVADSHLEYIKGIEIAYDMIERR